LNGTTPINALSSRNALRSALSTGHRPAYVNW
jgi:hypothetical protein